MPFTQEMLEEPVLGGREGEVRVLCAFETTKWRCYSSAEFLSPRMSGLEIWIWESPVYTEAN